MSRDLIIDALRRNWILAAVIVVCFAVPLVRLGRSPDQDDAPRADSATATDAEPAAVESAAPPLSAERRREEALAQIEAHRQAVDRDPESEDAAVRLHAMGNLYRQKLVDYEQAAQCYEQLLAYHPDSAYKRATYVQLLTCYDRLGDSTNRDRISRRIMDEFPEDSQEYEFAESVLYGRNAGAPT